MMDFKTALYQIIGSRIKKRRVELNLSQEELAKKIGLARTSISNIEVGRQQATISILYEICHELETDVHFILPTFKDVNSLNSNQPDLIEILKNKNINSASFKKIEDILNNLDNKRS